MLLSCSFFEVLGLLLWRGLQTCWELIYKGRTHDSITQEACFRRSTSECLEQANTHVQASAESLRLLLGIFTNRL